jgi:hypothetical protein
MYKHLLVPLDGSRLAETVFPAVAYLAEKLAARVTLLHVVERDAPETIHGQRHLTEAREAGMYLDEAARLALPSSIVAARHVVAAGEGGVARSIVQYAAESCDRDVQPRTQRAAQSALREQRAADGRLRHDLGSTDTPARGRNGRLIHLSQDPCSSGRKARP